VNGPWWDLEDAAIWVLWLRGETSSEIARIIGCKREQPRNNPRNTNGKIALWWQKELAKPKRNALWRKRFEQMTKGKGQ
jgi:hypothetical protein